MIVRLLAIFMTVVVVTPSLAELDPETIEQYSKSIVRTIVDGALSTGTPCSPRGTGFFIDKKGHILTAAHNVLPCSEGDLGPRPRWKSTPTIQVELFNSNPGPGRPNLEKVKAVIIYTDEQTDLALLRADAVDTQPLPLAHYGTLKAGMAISVMTFEVNQAQPSDKPVKIESLFNPNEQHKGLIDISGPDIKQSASGGPLFDSASYVAGVFTKGRNETGEAVVPISYAASLFSMCGVSYPSDEVREVIEELRKDIIHLSLDYEKSTGNVTWSYKKRLKAGSSPFQFTAMFSVYTSGGFLSKEEYGLEYSTSVAAGLNKGKEGRVIFKNVGTEIDNKIKSYNQCAGVEAGNIKVLGEKKYALVTIEAEFVGGHKVASLRDYLLRF